MNDDYYQIELPIGTRETHSQVTRLSLQEVGAGETRPQEQEDSAHDERELL